MPAPEPPTPDPGPDVPSSKQRAPRYSSRQRAWLEYRGVRLVLIALAIMFASLLLLWALEPVWDPFGVRERGVWRAYGRALPWISMIVIAVEALTKRVRTPADTPTLSAGGPPEEERPWPPAVERGFRAYSQLARGLASFAARACAVFALLALIIAVKWFLGPETIEGVISVSPGAGAPWMLVLSGFFVVAAVFFRRFARSIPVADEGPAASEYYRRRPPG